MKNYENQSVSDISALLEQRNLKDFLLEQGLKFGYPFFVFANGKCAANLVLDDEQSPLCLKVYRLSYLRNEGEKMQQILQNKEAIMQDIRAEIQAQHNLSEEQECLLVRFGTMKDLRGYLVYAKQLQMPAFQIIIEKDSYSFLQVCAFGDLTVNQEICLVQTASRYLLSNYLREYILSLEAERELVNRKDFELWDFYTQRGDFRGETYTYLRQLAKQEEKIALWLKGCDVY